MSRASPGAPIAVIADDEELGRLLLAESAAATGLEVLAFDNGAAALEASLSQDVAVVLLDVDMPGMDGFKLCSQLRAIPEYQQTPVVFVTSLSDFENKARSSLSGGNDLIAKPFLFMELAVKALTYLQKSQLGLLKAQVVEK